MVSAVIERKQLAEGIRPADAKLVDDSESGRWKRGWISQLGPGVGQ